jgi:hypothetical protein
MKQAGTEFDVHQLCLGLMQPWQLMAEQEETLKVAWLNQVVFAFWVYGFHFVFSVCSSLGLCTHQALSFCSSESEYLVCGMCLL